MIHAFEIRGGGKAALLLTKPAASGDACASPQGRRNKMRQPCQSFCGRLRVTNISTPIMASTRPVPISRA
jgi:hypothetical protein